MATDKGEIVGEILSAEDRGDTDTAIRLSKRIGWYARAAKLAEEQGDLKGAIRYHKKDKNYLAASKIVRGMGQTKRADRLFRKQIRHYKFRGNFMPAADLLMEIGETKKAHKLYEKAIKEYTSGRYYKHHPEYDLAAHAAEKMGDHKRAGDLHMKRCADFGDAAEQYEAANEPQLAKVALEREAERYRNNDWTDRWGYDEMMSKIQAIDAVATAAN